MKEIHNSGREAWGTVELSRRHTSFVWITVVFIHVYESHFFLLYIFFSLSLFQSLLKGPEDRFANYCLREPKMVL